MSPRAVLVPAAALVALCTAAFLPQQRPAQGASPLLWSDHHARQMRWGRQLQENQPAPRPRKRPPKGRKRGTDVKEEEDGGKSRDGGEREGKGVDGDEGIVDAPGDPGKTESAAEGGEPATAGEEKSDGAKEQHATGSTEVESGETGSVDAGDSGSPGDAPADAPVDANADGNDDTKEAGTDTNTNEEGAVDTKPPKMDDGSNTDKGTETTNDENEGKGRDTPREPSGETTNPGTDNLPQPQGVAPDLKDKPDQPETPIDAAPGFSTDLPVSLIGGGVVAGLLCLLAAGLYWRRSNEPVYAPVQGEDLDADGWNEGWDDGWGEGAGNEEVAAKA